jgi:GntR family transcriptional regulator
MALRVPSVKPGRGPAHAQIESWLDDAVAAGKLGPGDRLPPERELAERLGVSRMTLRHALDSLERRGIVVRHVGRDGGTFVAEPKLELAGLAGLSDQLRALGLAAGARVVSAVERDATTAEGELGARVYELVRVRLANGEPVALERGVYAADAFPGLLDEQLEGSLYELMRRRRDEVPTRAVERLEPVLADVEDAQALGVAAGSPLLLVERDAYGPSGRLLERSHDLFRGDRTRVVWESEILGS